MKLKIIVSVVLAILLLPFLAQAISLEFKGTGSMDDDALIMAITGDNETIPFYDYSPYHNPNVSVLGSPSHISDRNIAKWYGALNFSATSGDGVLYNLSNSIDDDMTGFACNFWVYHTTEPTGGSSQYYMWVGTSDSDNQHAQQGDYGVAVNLDTTNGTSGVAMGESYSDTTGYWSWIHFQYDDQTEVFKAYRNGDLRSSYTDTGAGNITWSDNYQFRLAYGDYNIDLHGYIDEVFCYNRGNFTSEEVVAEYRLKAQGTPPDLNLLALSDSIPDTSVLYDFTGSEVTLNTTGTIPYSVNVSNEGITVDSTDFNVTFTVDYVWYTNGTKTYPNEIICDERIQLDAYTNTLVTCNIPKYAEATIKGHVIVDAYDEVDEEAYSGRETDNTQPFYFVLKSFPRAVIPNQEYFDDVLYPVMTNNSIPDNIAYDAWNWYRSFVSDPVNTGWGAEDSDIRGRKGYENCVNAYLNNWGGGTAQQYCLDHLEHWFVTVDDWDTGSVQLLHDAQRMVQAFDLVARYLNKTDFDRFGAGMTQVCLDIYGKSNVRPDKDGNNPSPANGWGFGSGLGVYCYGSLGLNPENPMMHWNYQDKNGYVDTSMTWINRTIKYIASGKNDKDNFVGEGVLYAGYGMYNTMDVINLIYNLGVYDFTEVYNNELCGRGVEYLWNIQDFNYRGDTLRSDKSNYARSLPFGDSHAYYQIGEHNVAGASYITALAKYCQDPDYQKASLTIRRELADRGGISMYSQPLMDLFYYPPLATIPSLTTEELQQKFSLQNAYSFDRVLWRYGNWDYSRGSATVMLEGGEEVGAGHPMAEGLMLYVHVYGEPFIEGVQVPSEDVGRSEKFGNTFNFIDGNYSTSDYWTECYDAKYYQYFGRNGCSIDSMDEYPQMRFMPENYRGRTLFTFGIPNAEFGSAYGYKPYEGTTRPPQRAVIMLGDAFLTWDRTRMNAERYWEENFINSYSEFDANTSDNMIVFNRVGTDYRYKIEPIYNDTPIYSRTRSTGEQASNEKTGSPNLNFYYRSSHLYNNATTNMSLVVMHSWINGTDWSGYDHDNFQSYGDEGVNITTPLQELAILFDTSESDGLNLGGVTSDGWYLAKWKDLDTYASSNFTLLERYQAGTYTALDFSKPITAKVSWGSNNVTLFANSWQISSMGHIDVATAVTTNIDVRELDNRSNITVTKDGETISSTQVGDIVSFTMDTEKHGSEYILLSTSGETESFDLTSVTIKSEKGRRYVDEDLILSWVGTLLDRIIGDWRIGGISFHSINMPFDLNVSPYAIDYSTNGNNGTLSGATWNDAGIKDGSLTLDGSNDLVTISDNADFDLADNNLSGSMFFNLDTLPSVGTYETLVGKTDEWQIRIDENGVVSFVIMNETQGTGGSAEASAILEAWDFEEGTGTVAYGSKGVLNLTANSGIWATGGYCADGNCIMTTESINADLQGKIPETLDPNNYDDFTVCTVLTYHEYDTNENDNLFAFGNANHYTLDSYPDNPYIRGRFDLASGSSCNAGTSDSGFVVNQTYKICAGHDRTTNYIYVDGALLDSTACSDSARYELGGSDLRIGEGAFNGADLHGTYDSFVILSDSPDNVAVWYNNTGYEASSWTGGTTIEVSHIVNTTSSVSTGIWHSVQWDYDGTNSTIWINGTAKGESAVEGVTISDTTGDLTLGSYDGGQFIDGKIDEFYLTTRTISDTQAGYYESDGRAGLTLSHIDDYQTQAKEKWSNLIYATDDEFATNDENLLSNLLQIIQGFAFAPFIFVASASGGAYIVAYIIRRNKPRNRNTRRR